MAKKRTTSFEYDVCLSFAGEDRNYVKRVANALKSKGVRIFKEIRSRFPQDQTQDAQVSATTKI